MSVVQVAQHGITWGSILISVVSGGGFAAVLMAMIKIRPTLKKMAIDSDTKFRADLMDQLAKQDADHTARVLRLEAKLEDQRKMYETRIEYERVMHDAELSMMRHRMNNLDQCLTMLLALIETNPEKAQTAAARVLKMRTKQEEQEAAEKALISAGRVGATIGASANINAPAPPPTTP